MRLSARSDVAQAPEAVFDAIAEFRSIARLARRPGVEVERIDDLSAPAAGMGWRVHFTLRRRRRQVVLRLTRFDRPEGLSFEGRGRAFETLATLDLIALSPARTRMAVTVEILPRTLLARLAAWPARLLRRRLERRLDRRLSEYARGLERRIGAA